jgi:hypothetical protein
LYDQFCTAVNLLLSILSVQLTMGKTNQDLCMYDVCIPQLTDK